MRKSLSHPSSSSVSSLPLFLILTLITACSNSRASPFVWHCSKAVELFVKCVAMETNVCCHGDHVKSSFPSSPQTQEKRKRRQGGEIFHWKTKCFEILANLIGEVSKIEVIFKPSTLTNNSHNAFWDITSFNYVLRIHIVQGFSVEQHMCKILDSFLNYLDTKKPCSRIFPSQVISRSTEGRKKLVTAKAA